MKDPRDVFLEGAEWWANRNQQVCDTCRGTMEAEHYYPNGSMVGPGGIAEYPGGLDGTWAPAYIGRAFVEGARWQHYDATRFTMFGDERREAESEALLRYPLEPSRDLIAEAEDRGRQWAIDLLRGDLLKGAGEEQEYWYEEAASDLVEAKDRLVAERSMKP